MTTSSPSAPSPDRPYLARSGDGADGDEVVIPMRQRPLQRSRLNLAPFDDMSDSALDYAPIMDAAELDIYGVSAHELGIASEAEAAEWVTAIEMETGYGRGRSVGPGEPRA